MKKFSAFLGVFKSNFFSAAFNFALVSILSFLLTPFLVHELGLQRYGYIPLITQFVTYGSLIVLSINAATGRLVSTEILNGDLDAATQIARTACASLLLLSLISLPVVYFAAENLERIFAVHIGIMHEVKILFVAVACSFFLTNFRGVFDVASFSKNKIYLQNYNSVLEASARLMLVYIGFECFGASLSVVGISYFFASAIALAISVNFARSLNIGVSFSPRFWSKRRFFQLNEIGRWSVLNQLGAIIFLSLDIYLANKFISPYAAGVLGAISVWPTLLRSLSNYLNYPLTPLFVRFASADNLNNLYDYLVRALKSNCALVVGPVVMLVGLSSDILNAWIPGDLSSYSKLFSILIANALTTILLGPIFPLHHSISNVRALAISTIGAGIGHLVLAAFLLIYFESGLYALCLSNLFFMIVKNLLILPFMTARLLKMEGRVLLRDLTFTLAPGVCSAVASLLVCDLLIFEKIGHGWFAVTIGAFSYLAVYFFILFLVFKQKISDFHFFVK